MRRSLRRAGVALLVLVLLLALGLAVAWAWLHGPGGEAFAAAQVRRALAQALPGRMDFEGLTLDGSTVTLTGVTVTTPDGERVLAASKLEGTVVLGALADGHVHLRGLVLEDLEVDLVRDERGLTLTRAFTRDEPSPAKASPGGGLWLTLDDVTVRRGTVRYRDASRRERVGDVGGTLRLALKVPPGGGATALTLDAATKLTGTLAPSGGAPAQAVTVDGTAVAQGGAPVQVQASAAVADSRVQLAVDTGGPALKLQRATVTPAVVRRFVEGWPLADAVTLQGDVSTTALALQGAVARGTVDVRATYALAAEQLSAFTATVTDVDPSVLTGGGAPSRLSATLEGSLTGFTPTTATGPLRLDARWALPDGAVLGTAKGSATLAQGGLRQGELRAALPGASATLRGEVTPQRLSAAGALTATDLHDVERTVERFAQVDVPTLEGRGALAVTLSGTPAEPRLHASGRLSDVVAASVAAKELGVDLTVPNLLRPLESDGALEARRLSLGGGTFDLVKLKLATQGRAVDVRLVTKGVADVAVHARALVDRDGEGAQVSTLDVDAPPSSWRLAERVDVRWPKDSLDVPTVVLAAGQQRVQLQLRKQRKQLEGVLQLAGLELGALPRALGLADWKLAGRADGVVRLHGALPRPQAVAELKVSKASVRGVSGVGLAVTASTSVDGVSGELQLATAVGKAQGSFDVPWALVERTPDSAAPLRASVTVDALDVGQALATVGRPQPLTLTTSLTASVGGTVAHPTAALRAQADALDWTLPCATDAGVDPEGHSGDTLAPLRRQGCTVGAARGEQVVLRLSQLGAELSTADDGALRAQLSATGLGGPLTVELATPKSLRALWDAPPTAATLDTEPFTATLSARGLDLRWLAQAFPQADALRAGQLSVSATLTGPWREGRGRATVNLARTDVGPLDGLGATVELTGGDDVRVQLTSSLGSAALLTGDVRWAVPLHRLAAPVDEGARLAGTLTLASTALAALWPARDERDHVRGALTATVSLGGSLAAPELTASADGAQLAWGKVPLGALHADAALGPQAQTLAVTAGQRPGSPDLEVTARAQVPLSLAAVRNGAGALDGPLTASATARGLDLAFLSGAHPLLRRVAGVLTGSGQVTGTVQAPRAEGQLSLKDGRLSLTGYGDYRDVQLALKASGREVALTQLSARSGAGTVSLTATATALDSGAWALTASGDAKRFPLVVDDQLLATATLDKLTVDGTWGAQLVDLRRVAAAKLKVELPDVSGKKLQGLQRPGDIIVLRDGRRPGVVQDGDTAPARTIAATLELPRNVWVESSDVHLEVGLSDGFRVEAGNGTRAYGELFVMRGSVDVFGRRFEVAGRETSLSEPSRLVFAGNLKQPRIDVKATHYNDNEKVAVTAQVRAFSLDGIKLTSEPPGMTDSEIFTLLATGRRSLHRGTSASFTPEQAASALGAFASAQVRNVIAKVLPLDVFTVESSSAAVISRIEVGKYLNERLYVGGTIAPGANQWRGENAAAVRLEWQVSKHWAAEVEAGTAPAVNADIMWTREY